ncbi:MAG: hypothetical protein DRJ03_11660 [Chloroflexi bacterium]|nr:MAG: hypothetical protein DRJ03_11660 [Chloroflexota bacterium]
MSKSKTKPCPFCGEAKSDLERVYTGGPFGEEWRRYCIRCGVNGPVVKSKSGATFMWNERLLEILK